MIKEQVILANENADIDALEVQCSRIRPLTDNWSTYLVSVDGREEIFSMSCVVTGYFISIKPFCRQALFEREVPPAQAYLCHRLDSLKLPKNFKLAGGYAGPRGLFVNSTYIPFGRLEWHFNELQTLRFTVCGDQGYVLANPNTGMLCMTCYPDGSINIDPIELQSPALFAMHAVTKILGLSRAQVVSELLKFVKPNTAYIAAGMDDSWGIYKLPSIDPYSWYRVIPRQDPTLL